MDIEVSVIAEQLGKSLEKIAPQVEAELEQAVGNLAQAAYAAMIAKVQGMSMDPKNRQDYLRALRFETLGQGTWLIFLEGDWANKLEKGFGGYSIKEQLLRSEKVVEVGSRSGEPWVRRSKSGARYAAVPFDHHPSSAGKSGDLAEDIKKIQVLNRAGKQQSITKIFKDLEGKPIHGKVAVAGKIEGNPNLSNLTKYQFVHPSGKVSSVYMTYRMVSDNSSGWQHPGHPGYQLFEEAKKYVEHELKNILETLV